MASVFSSLRRSLKGLLVLIPVLIGLAVYLSGSGGPMGR